MIYGHRNDVEGYAGALEYFDSRLPEILAQLKEEDVLFIIGRPWLRSDHTQHRSFQRIRPHSGLRQADSGGR